MATFENDYNREFKGVAAFLTILPPVISSAARNLAVKTEISPSRPLTSFEPGSLEMTSVAHPLL